MATLEEDLYAAFAGATVDQETEQGESAGETTGDDGKLGGLAKDVATSIINFLLKQTFTITEMKAALEVEDFKCMAPGAIQTMPGTPVATSGGPGATTGPGNSMPINLSKGIMMTFGHAYVGMPAMTVMGSDTSDKWNDYTKVKLDPNKLVDDFK